jgi:hypothetical protein
MQQLRLHSLLFHVEPTLSVPPCPKLQFWIRMHSCSRKIQLWLRAKRPEEENDDFKCSFGECRSDPRDQQRLWCGLQTYASVQGKSSKTISEQDNATIVPALLRILKSMLAPLTTRNTKTQHKIKRTCVTSWVRDAHFRLEGECHSGSLEDSRFNYKMRGTVPSPQHLSRSCCQFYRPG